VTWSELHTEEPQLLGTKLKNLVWQGRHGARTLCTPALYTQVEQNFLRPAANRMTVHRWPQDINSMGWLAVLLCVMFSCSTFPGEQQLPFEIHKLHKVWVQKSPKRQIFTPYGGNWDVGLRWLDYWDRGFESRRRHGRLFLVNAMCCQVEVSATGWSFFQRNPTECCVSEYDCEASKMRWPWATRGCHAI
jgi:hypothetical protein